MTSQGLPPHTADVLLSTIVDETLQMRYDWGNYRLLFAEQESVDVLNATAPDLFRWVSNLAAHHVLMAIARLTDRASTGRGSAAQANATIERLLQATEWEVTDPPRWNQYIEQLAAVRTTCKNAQTYRHKRLGHFDLAIALNIEPAPVVTVGEIDAALDAIETLVGAIYTELRPKQSQAFRFINAEDHVNRLLHKLTNRTSKSRTNAISRITVVQGEGARLECGYCGEIVNIYMFSDDIPEPQYLRHWHFNNCSGLIGTETVTVQMNIPGREIQASTFDLRDNL